MVHARARVLAGSTFAVAILDLRSPPRQRELSEATAQAAWRSSAFVFGLQRSREDQGRERNGAGGRPDCRRDFNSTDGTLEIAAEVSARARRAAPSNSVLRRYRESAIEVCRRRRGPTSVLDSDERCTTEVVRDEILRTACLALLH